MASVTTNNHKKFRRLRLLERYGMFTDRNDGIITSRALTPSTLFGAWRLVHEIYVCQGYIPASTSGMRTRLWDLPPNTATFIASDASDIVGVFSLIDDSPELKLPSDAIFGSYLREMREEDRHVAEMTNQVTHPNYRGSAVSSELMRCVFAQGWQMGATDLICAVSPHQEKFFDTIGFTRYGAPRSYSQTIDDPVIFMVLEDIQNRWIHADLSQPTLDAYWKRFFLTDNPYLSAIPFWQMLYEKNYLAHNLPSKILEHCPELTRDVSSMPDMERLLLEQQIQLQLPAFDLNEGGTLHG